MLSGAILSKFPQHKSPTFTSLRASYSASRHARINEAITQTDEAVTGWGSSPHIGVVMHDDLSDDEADALMREPAEIIDGNNNQVSPRICTIKAIG